MNFGLDIIHLKDYTLTFILLYLIAQQISETKHKVKIKH